jgi:enamine deaminase RidA (YjgF/YER057c/UK114 family)
MPKQHLNPANMHTPTGYSHVVKAGDTIYIAGQVPVAPDGSIVGVDNPAAQAEQIYQNLQTALASVGASVRDVVKTTTYIVNPDSIDAVREARTRYFGENPPTSTLLVISRLARPEFLIEIEAIAYVG